MSKKGMIYYVYCRMGNAINLIMYEYCLESLRPVVAKHLRVITFVCLYFRQRGHSLPGFVTLIRFDK